MGTCVRYAAGVLHTPFTRYSGDALHGRYPDLTRVWVQLDLLFPQQPDAGRRVVIEGLDMTGRAAGLLSGWFRSVDGAWLGVVSYKLPYADGRREKVELVDQLVPAQALRPRPA